MSAPASMSLAYAVKRRLKGAAEHTGKHVVILPHKAGSIVEAIKKKKMAEGGLVEEEDDNEPLDLELHDSDASEIEIPNVNEDEDIPSLDEQIGTQDRKKARIMAIMRLIAQRRSER